MDVLVDLSFHVRALIRALFDLVLQEIVPAPSRSCFAGPGRRPHTGVVNGSSPPGLSSKSPSSSSSDELSQLEGGPPETAPCCTSSRLLLSPLFRTPLILLLRTTHSYLLLIPHPLFWSRVPVPPALWLQRLTWDSRSANMVLDHWKTRQLLS
jgi:hypothetical protein